ncbi:hypothetical protein MRX96_031194 [Rhipicephalus microplus]
MVEPTKLWSTELDLPADCVEFCPVRPSLFAVGMYKLDEEAGERQGALATFQWHGGADVQQLCHSGSLPGVLDIKWKDDVLAGAFSDGTVQLRRLREERLEPEASCQAASCLVLAVAWAPEGDKLAVSCSDGSVSTLSCSSASLESVAEIQCHSFEAWSVAWDATQPHTFYTGGDDCRFCCWDERSPGQAVRTLRRHSMGVTAIAPHPHQDHVLASGSYDEQVLLWDTRSFSKPLSEGQAGGGVWRLRWRVGPTHRQQLLAVSAMHGERVCSPTALTVTLSLFVVRTVLLRLRPGALERVCTYIGHRSMAYGIDWACEDTLASCSFYDKHLALWRHDILQEG